MSIDDQEQARQAKLIQLVRQAIEQDEVLREKYEIDNKFRFIRERLQALLTRLETELHSAGETRKENTLTLEEDEVIVYVYLYNAQGILLRSWQNMLMPKVFYEYSVNRPIYLEKSQIENVLRTKTNQAQHAYLTIAVKKSDILQPLQSPKDLAANPLVKVREGSLHFEKLFSFTHQGQDYLVNSQGELMQKKLSSA